MMRDTLQKFNTSQIANKPKVNEGGGGCRRKEQNFHPNCNSRY